MVVRIRLVRWGRRDMRLFRIVVADQRRALYGKTIEHVGNWDPKVDRRTGA
jgi:ribosomal protein S16